MNLVERVKGILLNPKKEWPIIEAESATPASLYTGYIILLAAIPPISMLLGLYLAFHGMGLYGGWVTGVIVQYVISLASVFILALIVDALAPNFGGSKSQIQALKLVAYASTAAWIGGIFYLIPALWALAMIGGLYSLVLLFLGLPVMMKVPQDKAIGYALVTIVIAAVLFYVARLVTGSMMGSGLIGMPM